MKLIVLDFYKDIAFIYTLNDLDTEKDNEWEYVANFLKQHSHRESRCNWMLTKNEIIIK